MPNGGSWDRFWYTITGFNITYGRWPTRVLLSGVVLDSIRAHLRRQGVDAPEDLDEARLRAQVARLAVVRGAPGPANWDQDPARRRRDPRRCGRQVARR